MLHYDDGFVQMKRIIGGNGRIVDKNDGCCCCGYCCGVDLLLQLIPLSAAAVAMVAGKATGIVRSMFPLLPSILL